MIAVATPRSVRFVKWVVVEADEGHPRTMTTGSHDRVMQVFEAF